MPSFSQTSKIYEARHLGQGRSISIDGRGGDPGWKLAHVLTDFSFPWNTRPTPLTEFRALWNEQYLYLRFDVTDADVVLGEGANAMDKVIGSDRVEIFFSTGPKLNPYYGIEIDPRGEVLDYEAIFHRQMNFDWSCEGLVVATSLSEVGYIVEGLIPIAAFRTLGCLHRDDTGDYLLAGLFRAEFSHAPVEGPVIEDWISWIDPQVATPDFHVPTSFGMIRLGT
ncbi:MAG TPA: sugar-binding protein [Planctomycetaceae bacterium]|nr:sugar-binding protein [Planctomycetaceae bacterium]